jgi:hypothetical protein
MWDSMVFKAGIWKLRGMRKALEEGICPLHKEKDAVHILLKCPETRKLREHLLSMKWLTNSEEIPYKKIINSEKWNIGSYLYKINANGRKN